jgi:EmrB/QacA subfamily drug resistance transporter
MDTASSSLGLTHREAVRITIGVLVPVFLGSLDQTIVAAALPTIGHQFGNLQDLSWVVTSYLLTGTAATPVIGKLSDIHGRRATMLGAIAIFLVGSVLCALAPSLLMLILARGVQGFGGGGLILLAMTILGDIAAPKDRAKYYTYFVVVFATAGASGPALGGFIAQYLHWSVIFWINLPLGLLSFALSNAQLKRLPRHDRPHRLDLLGAGLVVAATVALMMLVDLGGKHFAWISPPILALAVISLAGLSWFGLRLRRVAEPLVPLGVLSNPIVIFAILAHSLGSSSIMLLNVFVPIFLQLLLGVSASHSGLLLMTLMFSFNVGAGISGQITAHIRHYKVTPTIGLAFALAGALVLGITAGRLPLGAIEVLLTVIGLGFGTVPPVATVSLQNAVELTQLGAATASLNFVRSLAGTIFVGVFGALLAGRLVQAGTDSGLLVAHQAALAQAFQVIFFGAAGGFALSLLALWRMAERPLQAERAPPRPEPLHVGAARRPDAA